MTCQCSIQSPNLFLTDNIPNNKIMNLYCWLTYLSVKEQYQTSFLRLILSVTMCCLLKSYSSLRGKCKVQPSMGALSWRERHGDKHQILLRQAATFSKKHQILVLRFVGSDWDHWISHFAVNQIAIHPQKDHQSLCIHLGQPAPCTYSIDQLKHSQPDRVIHIYIYLIYLIL